MSSSSKTIDIFQEDEQHPKKRVRGSEIDNQDGGGDFEQRPKKRRNPTTVPSAIDPREDPQQVGKDGKPLCLIIGHLKDHPSIRMYVKKKNTKQEGSSQFDMAPLAYFISSKDKRKAPRIAKSTYAYDQIVFLSEYKRRDKVETIEFLKKTLSATDVIESLESLAAKENAPNRTIKIEDDDEESDEYCSNGNESLLSSVPSRMTRQSLKLSGQSVVDTSSLPTNISQSLGFDSSVSIKKHGSIFLDSVEEFYEEKNRYNIESLEARVDRLDAVVKKQVVEIKKLEKPNLEASSTKVEFQRLETLSRVQKVKINDLEKQLQRSSSANLEVLRLQEVLSKIQQSKSDNSKKEPAQTSLADVALGNAHSVLQTINGIVYKSMQGASLGLLQGFDGPPYPVDGSYWTNYEVLRALTPLKFEGALEDKELEIEGVKTREVIMPGLSGGKTKRRIVKTGERLGDDGKTYEVFVVKKEFAVGGF